MNSISIATAGGRIGVLLVLTLCTAPVSSAGVIRGQVTSLTGRQLPDVVVYIDSVSTVDFAPPEEHARMDQQNLEFIPHILPVLSGTTVDFHNSDHVLHNIFSPDTVGDEVNLGSYPRGEVRSHTFQKECDKACDAVMLCNVHPNMEAYVVVLGNPYFALTDSTGVFLIPDVPPGSYTLQTWDKIRKDTKTAITVTDDTLTLEIVLSGEK